MKKNVKKLFLLMVVVITAVLCLGFSASAKTWGDYSYRINENGTVTIEKYNGKATSVTIPSKVNGKNVTHIGERAFSDNAKLKAVKIPDTVTEVGNSAFARCVALSNVTFGKNIKILNERAFECSALTSVKIPDSVTVIGNRAFNKCGKIKSLTIGKNVKTIDDGAFMDCRSLTYVTIPDNVTKLGVAAFGTCTSLKSVIISKNIKVISDSAFGTCKSLTTVKIPDSVKSIGDYAFHDCSKLKTVTMSKNVKTIGNSAFMDCTALEKITIPDTVISIDSYAFNCCESLKSVVWGKKVKTLGEGVFTGCESLKDITLPDSITSIGNGTFGSCTSLESVTIGKNIKTIGEGLFSGCRALTNIIIPDAVTSIGADAFANCSALESVKMSKNMKKIGERAFVECYSLDEIALSSTVKSIGEGAFVNECNSDGMSTVILCPKSSYSSKWAKKEGQPYVITNPTGTENIIKGKSENVSWSIDKLTGVLKISVSGETEDFSEYDTPWYDYRSYVKSISFPKGITKISNNLFSRLYRIKSVKIPDSVTTIGKYAFSDCKSLERITIPNSVKTIDTRVFNKCVSLVKVSIPGSVKKTNKYWFSGCKNLKEVVFAAGVENIVSNTFGGCKAACKIVIKNKNCKIASDSGINSKHIIWGYKNSTAQAYAKKIGAKFIDINHKHTYKDKITKATLNKNGKAIPTCEVCGKTTTATAIYYPKTIKLSATRYSYNGKVITPSVTVKDSKGNILKKDTDYTVKYASGRKNPGKYAVAVVFKGKYKGTLKLYFSIKPATPAIKTVASTAKGRVAVAWANVAGESGYQVSYSTKKDSGYKVFMTSKADVVKVGKNGLASGKTYYFKVRAYKTAGDTVFYSGWSAAKAIKIK